MTKNVIYKIWKLGAAWDGKKYSHAGNIPPNITAFSISASAFNTTTVRYTISGGSGATSWTVYYRTPAGSGAYTSQSVTPGITTFDVTVSAGGNADLYLVAANSGGSVTSNTVTGSAQSSSDVYAFPLKAGNAIASANLNMRMVHPRPDADGGINSWERHKLQPEGIPLRIPVGVLGGIPPFRYSVTSTMSGLTIGADMPNDWWENGLQNYGVLMCDAPTAGTYTTTVTGTDQAGTQVSSTFTTVVIDKNDTTKFRWFDSVNGNNANSGSYASPYKDDLTKAYGATSGATTFQGHVIFKDTATYSLVGHSDTTPGIRLNSGRMPIVYYTMPVSGSVGQRAKFDFTGGKFIGITGFSCLVQGMYIGEIDHTGSTTGVTNMHNYYINDAQDRITFFNIDNTSIGVGSAGTDNATFCFFSNGADSTDASYNHNVFFRRVRETGRPSSSNSYGMTSAYGLKYALFEDCHEISSSSAEDFYLKDSDQQVTLRYCSSDNNMAVGAQNQNGGTSGEIEYVHCRVNDALGGTAIGLATAGASGTLGNIYVSRCTTYGKVDVNSFSTATGTYAVSGTVIYTSLSPAFNNGGKSSTNTGNELQGNTAYINTTTLKLTDTYAAYRGTRGAEIFDV